MTAQKQIECAGWRVPRARTAQSARRPVLCGYDNFNNTAVDNSRARLIADIINPNVKSRRNEFSSYFFGSQYDSPKESLMSHSPYLSEQKRRPFISSYPSLVALRWNPKIETSSVEDSRRETTNDLKFHCKCTKCPIKNCRSKNSSSSTLKPIFKNNIMTFSDKDTMTSKLKDAFCAARSALNSSNTSEASFRVSSPCRDVSSGLLSNDCIGGRPVPILKKENLYKCERCGYTKDDNVTVVHKPHRDTYDDYKECSITKSVKSIFKFRRQSKTTGADESRRTIYNEGINDTVAHRCPLHSMDIPSKIDYNTANSRVSISSKTLRNKYKIPFSHKYRSKYHSTCKDSATRLRLDADDDLNQLVGTPEVLKRCYTHKPVKHTKLPNIRLPRKVLASEKNIESYVDKKPRSHSGKRKKQNYIQ